MRTAIGRIAVPVTAWLVGNLAWGLATFVLAKVAKDVAMIEAIGAIGFLVLIVVALVYLMFRGNGRATPTVQLENMARFVTMMYFAQQYHVQPSDLADLSTPQAMEERAKRLLVENQLAAFKRSTSGTGVTPP